jgi:hypothetical protein
MPEKLLTPARHETSDVGPVFIWAGIPLILLTVLALALLVLWLYPKAISEQGKRLVLPQFPEPQLQPSPRDSMARFYGTGWIEKAKGTVHIPIGIAMRKIAEEGIPGWPAPQEKKP